MKGRKPKPTALKELQGNPGKRAINRLEPKPSGGKPNCPAWLSGEAKKEWRRIAGELYGIGLLSKVDRAALAGYCQSFARWMEAEQKLDGDGEEAVIENTKGNLVVNPWVSVAQRAKLDMLKFASEFGLTPSSRSRLKVEGDGDVPTLAEQLFQTVQEAAEAKNNES